MLDHDHGDAALPYAPDQLDSLPHLGLIQPRQPFIEEQQRRIGREGAGQFNALLIDVGQLPCRAGGLICQADIVEQFVHTSRAGVKGCACAAERTTNQHVLARSHAGKDAHQLEGPADPAAANPIRREADEVAARQAHAARIRPYVTGDEVENRGLARSVRPDQSQDLALVDGERKLIDRNQPAERLVQAGYREQRFAALVLAHDGPPAARHARNLAATFSMPPTTPAGRKKTMMMKQAPRTRLN